MADIRQVPLIWNREAETMPREQLEQLQLERVKQTVDRVYHCVPYYKQCLDEQHVRPQDIQSLQDIVKLPFTSKKILRDHYPFGLVTVPVEQLVRVHASSGTTGKPTVGPYTARDLDQWAELMARMYTAGGVTSNDVIHNAFGYGLFTGGLGFHLGGQRIGCTVVPVSSGLSKRQIMLMEDFGATVLGCTPSYALVLAETATELGIDFRQRMRVRVGFFGAEPWTDEMRQEIDAKMNLESFDNYGLTEMGGPGVSVECPYHCGLHIAEDHFLAELIDPETDEPVKDGNIGELVFTSLTREAMPLLRYRTRDRVVLTREKCACGRTTARMSKVKGRTDDMLIIRGVNVFPSSIESVLLSAEGIAPHYLIVIDRPKDKLDSLEIRVEASPELWKRGEYWRKQAEQHLYRELYETLGLTAIVKVCEPHSLQRSEGKAKRIIDRRDLVD